MDDWETKRLAIKVSIERWFALKGFTVEQAIAKGEQYGFDRFSKKEGILIGVWRWIDGEIKAEEAYDQAILDGATEIILPKEVGERGYFIFECPCQMKYQGQYGDRTEKIELTIFPYNVWTCSKCRKVLAILNMAAVDDGVEGL